MIGTQTEIPQLTDAAQSAVDMGGNVNYMKWLESNKYDVSNMTSKDFAYTEKLYDDRGIGGPGETSTDWGMKGLGGTLLGAGQLGLGVMSYLDQSKTADKQRALMDQQMVQNKYVLDTAKGRASDINNTFGKR